MVRSDPTYAEHRYRNRGNVLGGNFRSQRRREYKVIGDTVTTVSRLRELTKEFYASILVRSQLRKNTLLKPSRDPQEDSKRLTYLKYSA